MVLDREYVCAGFTGLLLSRIQPDTFIAQYCITSSEQRRAAVTVVQVIMQGGPVWPGDEGSQRVGEIAREFGFTQNELTSMAWEVLRGTLDPNFEGGDGEAAEIALHVLRNFLKDMIPRAVQGPAFSYTGYADSFQPKDSDPQAANLIGDIVYRDLGGNADRAQLSPEKQQLLQDLGL